MSRECCDEYRRDRRGCFTRRLPSYRADVVVQPACLQMQSLPVIQIVEDRLGVPVTSTAACTSHQRHVKLGLEPVLPNAGAQLSGGYGAVSSARAAAK